MLPDLSLPHEFDRTTADCAYPLPYKCHQRPQNHETEYSSNSENILTVHNSSQRYFNVKNIIGYDIGYIILAI